nr:unnamed protein product [Digitaria exilis]
MNCTGSGAPWFLQLSRSYDEAGGGAPVQKVASSTATGCQFSAVPVMPGSELKGMGDYERLWTVPGDCAACNASGGQCRYETEVNAFSCLCRDGSTQPHES